MFYAAPRVFTVASVGDPVFGSTASTVDLRRTSVETIVHPGQALSAAFTAQWAKGLVESELEGLALEKVESTPPITTVRVFDEMDNQDIHPVLLTPNDFDLLEVYPFSSEARAHITTALLEGNHVLVPTEAVEVDGKATFAWWEFNPETGETVSVGENGLHISFSQLAILVEALIEVYSAGSAPGGSEQSAINTAQAAEKIGLKLKGYFEEVAAGFPNGDPLFNGPMAAASASWRYFPAYLCPVDNCGLEQFFITAVAGSPIPLPEISFAYETTRDSIEQAFNTLMMVDAGGGIPAFTISANPASSNITPIQTANFQVVANGNFDDDLTIGVYAPDGWNLALDATGNVTATPSEGLAPGNYTIEIVAQSKFHPELFDTIQHTINFTAGTDLGLSASLENQITVPMGLAAIGAVSNQTNDGEAETPNSAYIVEFINPSGSQAAFDLTVSGLPTDWAILNGERQMATSVTLPPGAQAQIGLYVSPPNGTLPSPGTAHTIQINVSGASLADSTSAIWTMPSQPFNFLTSQPDKLYLSSGSSADFSLQMTGVGNDGGSFPIIPILPTTSVTITGLAPLLSLAVGETQEITGTIETGELPLGTRFPLVIGSTASGSYTQYAVAEVQVISEDSEAIFRASDNAAKFCTLGEPGLSDALESLALAMIHLEAACNAGKCNTSLRDQVVNAIDGVALYSGAVSMDLISIDPLLAAADSLADHEVPADVYADLGAISALVDTLDTEVCNWSQHKPQLRWTPYYGAALQNESTAYTLELTNLGSRETTYVLTTTLAGTMTNDQVTLAPGATHAVDNPLTIADIGLYDLNAVAQVIDNALISTEASARLNVVDRFVQLTVVQPVPSFVETGSSSSTISIEVANIANIAQNAMARTTIQASGGGLAYSSDNEITVLVGAPRSYELETVDTSSWTEGVYTVTVELLDEGNNLIPDGSGYGHLGVGQLLGASHALSAEIVPPGEITITTHISTELLEPGIVPPNVNTVQALVDLAFSEEITETSEPPILSSPQAVNTTNAISRTEDVSSTIVYSGSWSTINNIYASYTSDGNLATSNTPGDYAMFNFSGTWVHIGMGRDRNGGQAEILIDGISQGMVDLYSPHSLCYFSTCLASFAFGGLTDSAHILEIVVAGTSHPNSGGTLVKLDYIDTWDGTEYPNGLFEQDDARVWGRLNQWSTITEAEASGGSFMQSSDTQSIWFPFTGDSVSFVSLARFDGHQVKAFVDGVWQGDLRIYSNEPISKTYSFSGFGEGPHILQISGYRAEPSIDAFITPATGPDYEPPTYTGLVRYEENHPALFYNGFEFNQRPVSWSVSNEGQASDFSYAQSSTLSDTVSLDFYGSWVNIGLRTRNRGGLADVSIDGVSYGTINSYSDGFDVTSYQFPVITGTHTLTITVLDQSDPANAYNQVYLDFIEIWDGTPTADGFQNSLKAKEFGRVHVSSSNSDGIHENAIQGDFVNSGLPNSNANVWYSFVGDAFTFYGLTVSNGGSAEVYVDGQLYNTVSFDYPFSVQPFAFNYSGFDLGPHSVRIHNVWEMRVDGFAANQPDLPYQPMAEWWDDTPGGGTGSFGTPAGMLMGIAAGDLDGDGLVELIAPSDTYTDGGFINSIFIYRGDGQDAGNGTPLIRRIDFPANGIGVGREVIGSVALAELDYQPGTEIVVGSDRGMYAIHHTGVTYWFTDTFQGGGNSTTVTPAVGNLDLDGSPEIVTNMGNSLVVYTADGDIAWFDTYTSEAGIPVLADITSDGLLDIVAYDIDGNVNLYDFNFGSPQLLWSTPLSTSIGIVRGGPAVADIDGNGSPEIVIAHNGYLTVLDNSGNLVGSVALDPGAPGGVSVADIDGDSEIEIVTGMMYDDGTGVGRLYALNADGSILWERPAYDDTSANSQSVLDLDGDGIYEIAWNGAQYGFTIFNGADGTILFNEPVADSLTATDYPIFADVDSDDYAEIIVPSNDGIVVFGLDGVWGNARPLWNQHTYHITNINDDLSIPFSELNSWEVHNTYRTQTPQRYPMPIYSVALTHTVGLEGVNVLTDTFNVEPDLQSDPLYHWAYEQSWENTVITRTFDTHLTGLQPGEIRLVAEGTVVDYVQPSGTNQIELPPLYVSVERLVDLDPATLSLGNGATGTFTLTLRNPETAGSIYTPTVTALAGISWGQLNPVWVPASDEISIPLTLTVALDVVAGTFPFGVNVTTDQGSSDQVGGEIEFLGSVLDVALSSSDPSVPTGSTGIYTLTVTNLENQERTYNLSATGIAPVSVPAQITVPANSDASTLVTAQAIGEGQNPFSVIATEVQNGASEQDTASVIGEGFAQVAVILEPDSVSSGPGVPTVLDVLVINLGNTPDTFTLETDLPSGWEAELSLLSTSVDEILVIPGMSNAMKLQLIVTPVSNAAQGNYNIGLRAASMGNPTVSMGDEAEIQIGALGVGVAIISGPGNISPTGSSTWEVEIANHGQSTDTYDLSVFGPLGLFAELSQESVTLAAGDSQTVQLTADGYEFSLNGEITLGILAQSQTQSAIQNEDFRLITVITEADVEIGWEPGEITVEGITDAGFSLVIANTGNDQSTFAITINGTPGLDIQIPVNSLLLPPGSTAKLLVKVMAPGGGSYELTAIAANGTAQDSATATLNVEGVEPPKSGFTLYIPIITR